MFTLCCVRFLWRCKCNCETAWVQTSSVLNCDVKLTTLCHLILSVTLTIIISTESCATSGYRCYCGYRGYRAVMQHATKSADVQMQIMNFCIFHTINTFAYFQHSLFVKSSAGRLPSRARCITPGIGTVAHSKFISKALTSCHHCYYF